MSSLAMSSGLLAFGGSVSGVSSPQAASRSAAWRQPPSPTKAAWSTSRQSSSVATVPSRQRCTPAQIALGFVNRCASGRGLDETGWSSRIASSVRSYTRNSARSYSMRARTEPPRATSSADLASGRLVWFCRPRTSDAGRRGRREDSPPMQDDAALLMEAGGSVVVGERAGVRRPRPSPSAPAGPDGRRDDDEADGVLPRELVCPITQELMRDPVLAADGFSTSGRDARWFGTGRRSRSRTSRWRTTPHAEPRPALHHPRAPPPHRPPAPVALRRRRGRDRGRRRRGRGGRGRRRRGRRATPRRRAPAAGAAAPPASPVGGGRARGGAAARAAAARGGRRRERARDGAGCSPLMRAPPGELGPRARSSRADARQLVADGGEARRARAPRARRRRVLGARDDAARRVGRAADELAARAGASASPTRPARGARAARAPAPTRPRPTR